MAKIFVCYAHEDTARVEVLVERLREHQLQVMWDRDIPIGGLFRQTIRAEVDSADAVIVAWSQASVESHWVEGEADCAAKARKLFPILLDAVEPPLPLGAIQGADFSDWEGDGDAECFQRLLASVTALRGRNDTAPPMTLPRPVPGRRSTLDRKLNVVLVLFVVGLVGAAWALSSKDARHIQAQSTDAAVTSVPPSPLPVVTATANNEATGGAAAVPKPGPTASTAPPVAPPGSPKPAKLCCHPSGSLRACAKPRCSDCQLLECTP